MTQLSEVALGAAIIAFALSAAVGVMVDAVGANPRRRVQVTTLALALTAIGAAATLVLGAALVFGGAVLEAAAGSVLTLPVVDLRYDGLSGVFLLALGAVGVAGAFEARDDIGAAPANALTRAAHPVFVLALLLVFGSTSAFSFLLAWELMALASGALVIGARPSAEQLRAGFVYLAATHLATAALVVGFAVLAAAADGQLGFGAWAAAASGLDPLALDAVFLLFVVGFGTKAGVMPFHVWLPRAHPAAPSHVSALMSGVMIKTGIYGLIRLVGDILGGGPEWWGLLLIGLGAVSAVLGVLYALMEYDLKRLLAFSSIENIGIVLIAVGAAFVFQAHGLDGAAAVALAAALLHSLNHALFKGLLFLGAGAVQHAAGTRDLNRLGGLARAMPRTALAFGIGAAAIAGLPPLNGFVGEWQTFQALLGIAVGPVEAVARSVAIAGVGALALSAALALAAAVKVTGITFLALPRSPGAAAAHEAPRATLVALGSLAGLCLAAGIGGAWMGGVLGDVAAESMGATPAVVAGTGLPALIGSAAPGAFSPLPLAALLAVVVVGTVLAAGLLARGRAPARGATWVCGIAPDAAYEYTATSFAKPVRLFFRRLLRPSREVVVEHHPGTQLPRSIAYRGDVSHVIDRHLYTRPHAAAIGLAQVVRRLQNGSLQLYLAYALTAVILLLVIAR